MPRSRILRISFISDAVSAPEREAAGGPARGKVWIGVPLAARLELKLGDTLRVGRSALAIDAIIRREPDSVHRQVAEKPPPEWQVVTVDLWEVLGKPVRVRGLRLAASGGPAAFDSVVLAR